MLSGLLARRVAASTLSSASVVVPSRSHTGYIPFEGRFDFRDDEKTRLLNQCRSVDLQPVKKVTFTFDPFLPDCKGIRNLMFSLSFQKTRATNPKCVFKTEMATGPNSKGQIVRVELNDELGLKPIVFRAGTLTVLEMLYELNRLTLPLVKRKEDDGGVSTKSGGIVANPIEAKKGRKKRR